LPGTSALFRDYITDWSRVRNFYPQDYSLDSITAFAQRRPPPEPAHLKRLSGVLREQQKHWGASPSSAAAIDKLSAGAVAVMTGQQPGLFTGPVYTIHKAITAMKLAKALDARGIPAVPVFWVASEDHDFEEIQWAAVVDRDSQLKRLSVDLANDYASPVGWLRFNRRFWICYRPATARVCRRRTLLRE
jgi:uncharacterized protein YllA (UPF0747 family)